MRQWWRSSPVCPPDSPSAYTPITVWVLPTSTTRSTGSALGVEVEAEVEGGGGVGEGAHGHEVGTGRGVGGRRVQAHPTGHLHRDRAPSRSPAPGGGQGHAGGDLLRGHVVEQGHGRPRPHRPFHLLPPGA